MGSNGDSSFDSQGREESTRAAELASNAQPAVNKSILPSVSVLNKPDIGVGTAFPETAPKGDKIPVEGRNLCGEEMMGEA